MSERWTQYIFSGDSWVFGVFKPGFVQKHHQFPTFQIYPQALIFFLWHHIVRLESDFQPKIFAGPFLLEPSHYAAEGKKESGSLKGWKCQDTRPSFRIFGRSQATTSCWEGQTRRRGRGLKSEAVFAGMDNGFSNWKCAHLAHRKQKPHVRWNRLICICVCVCVWLCLSFLI